MINHDGLPAGEVVFRKGGDIPGNKVWVMFLCVMLCTGPLFSLLPGETASPGKALTQYVHDSWGPEGGLQPNYIKTIIQTRDGYLWLGTIEGLVRFDGQSFTVFDNSNTPELKDHFVKALVEDRDGVLWIGTNSGLIRRKGGAFLTRFPGPESIAAPVSALCGDQNGTMWVGTDGDGLFMYREGVLSRAKVSGQLKGKRISSLYNDRRGNLWVGTYSGLSCIGNNSLNHSQNYSIIPYPHQNQMANRRINTIFEDTGGRLWIGTNNGLTRIADGKLQTVTVDLGLNSNRVRVLWGNKNHNLWIGTAKGIQRVGAQRIGAGSLHDLFRPGGNRDSILTNQEILSIFEDREGSLWVGTFTGGLHRFKEGHFTTYSRDEGLSHDKVWCILPDGSDGVWLGTDNGLNRIKTSKQGAAVIENVLPGIRVQSLGRDRQGNLWLGTAGALQILDKSNLSSVPPSRAKQSLIQLWRPDFTIRAIYEDPEGHMWVGTSKGLHCFKNRVPVPFPGKEKLSGTRVYVILRDSRGLLWLGTDRGLYRLSGDELKPFSGKNSHLSKDLIYSLYAESGGALWVGANNGLTRIKDGRISRITRRDGLFSDIVDQILEDGDQNLWMSCDKGIFRLNKKNAEDFFDGKIKKVECVSYNETDGMKSRICIGGLQPAGCRTAGGRLWFPTLKGAVSIAPGNLNVNPLPPPVVIESIRAGQTTISLTASPKGIRATVPPGVERLVIGYTALSFPVPDRVRFRTMLDGYDPGWSNVTKHRTVDYTKLPPGRYTFRVKACNNDGVWNDTGAAVSIYIRPTFIQTPWFLALCAAGIFMLLVFVYRLRVRQLKTHARKLRTMVEEKTRDLEGRNHELVSLDETIKNINRETRLHLLLGSLLEQAVALYPAADKAFYYLYNHRQKVFKPAAVQGYNTGLLDDFSLTYDEAVGRYTSRGKHAREGVYIIKDIDSLPSAEKTPDSTIPKVMLIMAVKISGRFEGFLVLENMTDSDAFDNSNLQLLSTLREHAVSAIARARIMEQLDEEKKRAESASLAKSTFIANMSHEIRTPMNAILGFNEILQNEISDKSHLKMLQTVSAAGNTLLQLINNILDIARIEAGKIKLEPEPVCLSDIITEIKDIFSIKVQEKYLDFMVEISPDLPSFLLLDNLHLRQMLLNLTGNAVKFTGAGFVKLAVRHTSAANVDNAADITPNITTDITITVEDTGIGIPDDQREAIFKAFTQQRGQETAKYEGTGLGLSITSLIARSMGGEITVRGREGGGSVFEVFLPRVPICAGHDAGEKKIHGDIDLDSVRFLEGTVLVVDDNRQSRELIKQYLKSSALTIIEAGNGKDGLESVDHYRPRIVLMDVNMPVMGGVEATQIIKSDRRFTDVAVILLSASVLKADVNSYMTLSKCDAFLGKPFTKNDLVARMIEFLPYDTGENVPAKREPASKAEPASKTEPATMTAARLPELIDLLNDTFLPDWEQLSNSFIITDKEKFAARIRGLGNKFESPQLIQWGENLLEHFKVLNLVEISRLWDDFPRLIKVLSEG